MESIICVSNGFGGCVEMRVKNTENISSLVENVFYRQILEAAGILYETSTLEKVVFCLFTDNIFHNIYITQNDKFSVIHEFDLKNPYVGIVHRAG